MKRFLLVIGLIITTAVLVAGGSSQGRPPAAAAPVTPNFPNKVWVDPVSGSDSTGKLQREDLPYASLSAAFTAARSATGNWIMYAMPGPYTDTGLKPHAAATNIAVEWQEGSYWSSTGSNYLYDLTDDTFDKPLYILGRGRFYGSNTFTGGFVNSSYGATVIAYFKIEAELLAPGSAGSFWILRGAFDANDQQTVAISPNRNNIKIGAMLFASATPAYFRIAGNGGGLPFVYLEGNYIAGVSIDEGNFIVRAGYAEAFKLAPNGFGPGESLILHCVYRFKATSQPALDIRSGQAVISSPYYEITDGGAPIFNINSAADTSAGALQLTIMGGRLREWPGGSAPAILFDSTSSNFRVRLVGATTVLMANSATNSIVTTGSHAQTIEVFGSLDTNLALDSDITVRGATPTVNASYWTDF